MLVNIVNLAYAMEQEQEEFEARERKPSHYPSSLCAMVEGKFHGTCRRQMWYSWKNVKKTDPPDSPALFKMNVGDLIHSHLTRLVSSGLEQKGWHVFNEDGGIGEEVAFHWQHPDLYYLFSGRMDGRFKYPSEHDKPTYLGVEWKSIYGMGVNAVKNGGPKEDALMQCAVYLEQTTYPVDAIALMYACRDSGYFIGYEITKDGPSGNMRWESMSSGQCGITHINMAGIAEALRTLEKDVDDGNLPQADWYNTYDKANKWRCDYCSYRGACYEV